MDDDITVVKNVKVKFLSTKEDNYNNSICWFKVDKGSINKFSVLKKDGYKLPYFESNDGKTLLKVKSNNVKIDDLNNDVVISCDMCFKYYKINDFEGYYVSKLA